jgi:hypothetical protein
MMANGFRVNLSSLNDAAQGVSGTISLFDRQQVCDIPFNPEDAGRDDVAGCTSDFLSGWHRGVSNLAQDGKQISAHLTACVSVYSKTEDNVKNAVTVQGTGTDPGTTVV